MKKFIKTVAYIALTLAVAGCAKAVAEGPNEANKRYFDAWMELNHKGLQPSGLGIYVLENTEGTGNLVKKDGFAYVEYTKTDLEGNISDYTDKVTAKQLGVYDTTYYYGPRVLTTIDQTIPTGVLDALVGMKVGGRKKVIIPSWLMTYYVYGSKEEYLANASSATSAVYDLEVKEYTEDITEHERKLIDQYIGGIEYETPRGEDKVFYYRSISKPEDKVKEFPSDTIIYINYTGKLLNGLVFDTTNEKVAKDNGLYSSSRTYGPVAVSWGEDYSKITMGDSSSDGSSVISGFAMTLWEMGPFEKGIGIFSSPYGYSYSGSGNSIPGYAPLIFEIEIVAKPEE